MNKKEFLKELEKRLSILEDKEIKDIINEYRDIIEEKIKDGKSENAAVEEFGSINELCSEILKAYKINPDYMNNNHENKNNSKSFDEWINNTSNELSKFIKNTCDKFNHNGKPLSLELIMEIFIKLIIYLVILLILRIPFLIISSLGKEIFHFSFSPIDSILVILGWLLSSIVYLGLAIIIFWILFRQYFNVLDDKDSNNQTQVKKSKKKPVNEVKEPDNIKNTTHLTNTNPLLLLTKIIVLVSILLPLWVSQALLLFVLFLSIYYIVIGIPIIGLTIVVIGLLTGIGGLSDFIYNLTFNTKKLKIYSTIPMIISIPLTIIGSIILTYNIMAFEYINQAPDYNLSYKTTEKVFRIESNKSLKFDSGIQIEYSEDNNYSDNKIKLILSYPSIIDEVDDFRLYEQSKFYLVKFELEKDFQFKELINIHSLIVQNLQEGKIYNYNKLNQLKIMVIGNSNTITNLKGA